MTKRTNSFKFPEKVLEPVKNFLTEELLKLKKNKKQVAADDPFADESRIDNNSAPDFEADEQFGHARSEAIGKELNKRIIQIKKALSRVKIGRYGICESCGQFIDTKRLMVYPETTLCVKCMQNKKKSN